MFGRPFATANASADVEPMTPMAAASTIAFTKPRMRETIVPEARNALARPMRSGSATRRSRLGGWIRRSRGIRRSHGTRIAHDTRISRGTRIAHDTRISCGIRTPGLAANHCDFDLRVGGLSQARYLKVEDGEIYPCLAGGTITEGTDIDAVEVLNAR